MGAWVFFDELVLSVIVLVAVGFCVISGISIGVKHKLKHTLWTWSHLGPWWYIGGLIVIGVTSIGFQRTGTATTACSINGAFMYIGVAIAAFSCHHLLVHHTLSCVCAQTWAPPAWAAWLFRHFVLLHHVITCVLPILLAAAMNAVDPAVFATATTCSFNTRAGAAFIGLVPLFFVALSMVLLVVLHMTRSTTAGWVSRSHAAMYAVLGSLLALQIGTIHALNSTPTSEWQVIHITAFIVQSCLVLVVSTIWTMAPVSRHQQRASIEGKRGGKRSQHTSAASVDHRTTAVGSRQASYLMANNGAPETNDDLPFEWDDAASTPSFNSKLRLPSVKRANPLFSFAGTMTRTGSYDVRIPEQRPSRHAQASAHGTGTGTTDQPVSSFGSSARDGVGYTTLRKARLFADIDEETNTDVEWEDETEITGPIENARIDLDKLTKAATATADATDATDTADATIAAPTATSEPGEMEDNTAPYQQQQHEQQQQQRRAQSSKQLSLRSALHARARDWGLVDEDASSSMRSRHDTVWEREEDATQQPPAMTANQRARNAPADRALNRGVSPATSAAMASTAASSAATDSTTTTLFGGDERGTGRGDTATSSHDYVAITLLPTGNIATNNVPEQPLYAPLPVHQGHAHESDTDACDVGDGSVSPPPATITFINDRKLPTLRVSQKRTTEDIRVATPTFVTAPNRPPYENVACGSGLSHHIDGYTPMSTPKPMPAVGPRPVAPPKKPVRRHRVKQQQQQRHQQQQQQQQVGVQGPAYASSPLHAEEHSDGAVYYAMNELPRPPPAATAYAGAGTAAAQQQHAGGVTPSPYVPIEMTRRDAAGVRPIHLPRPAQQKPLVITERMSPTTRKHQL